MTDKKIIIDDCDVSKCKYYTENIHVVSKGLRHH